MNKEDVIDMLEELVEEIDYDIYKEIFCGDDRDTEFALRRIVGKYINIDGE